jgi:hypothetical protein
MKRKVFISGALSSAQGTVRLEVFYERIGELCEGRGMEVFIPHRDANPERLDGFTNDLLYQSNMERLKSTDLIIAYAGLPSIGVGMEVQEACHLNIDVITLAEKGFPVSKPLQGCPSVMSHVAFKDFDDAIAQLEVIIGKWMAGGNGKAQSREFSSMNNR